MRRRIIILATFVGTLALVDVAVRRRESVWSAYHMDRIQRKLGVLRDRNVAPDVLIVGSSRTAYAMVPEEFERATGLTAFNLGVPATKIVEWRHIVRKALKSCSPKAIVLGINASEVRGDYLPTYAAWSLFETGDYLEYTLANGWSSEMASNFLDGRLMDVWPTYGWCHELKFWMQEGARQVFPKHAQLARERRELVARRCSEDGFDHPWLFQQKNRNLQEQIDEFGDDIVAKASVPAFDRTGATIDAFDRLLQELKSSGVPVLLCYIPNSPRTVDRWRDVEPRMKQWIADCCDRQGVAFVDTTPGVQRRKNADYVDECHAGMALAKEISRLSAMRLADMGETPLGNSRLATSDVDEGLEP